MEDIISEMIGRRFGRLIVIEFIERKLTHIFFKCKCDCGNYTVVSSNNLRRNHVQSCGCLQRERASNYHFKHGESLNKTTEYRTWKLIKYRCSNINDKKYSHYGGRGVTMCKEWMESFETFLKDMGRKPCHNYSIERIDVNGNYDKNNCKWATNYEQNRNKRNNIWLQYNGKRMVLQDWAKEIGVSYSTIYEHYHKKTEQEIFDFYKNKGKIK